MFEKDVKNSVAAEEEADNKHSYDVCKLNKLVRYVE